MPKHGRRISKRRDPWYNKWFHYGKRLAAGASGGALGYLYGNIPGAVAGARTAWAYVGKYKRPIRVRLASNPRWRFGSNPGNRYGSNPGTVTGSNPPGPVLGSNPGPGRGIMKRSKFFKPNFWHRRGVRKAVKYVYRK